MSLRRRAFLLATTAVVLTLVIFGWIAQSVVVAGFTDLERADAAERLQRIASALEADLDGQLAVTRSYAEQPEVALLLRGEAGALDLWRGSPEVLRSADLDALLFLDGLGRPVHTATDGRPLPLALERRLRDNSLRVSATGEPHVRGLVTAETGVAAFVAHQVRGGIGTPPIGTLLSVRRIDAAYLDRLEARSFVEASLLPVRDRGFRMVPVPFRPEGVHTTSEAELVHATAFLTDPAGWYAVEVTTEVPRAIAAAGEEASDRLFLLIIATTVAVSALLLVWFERRLLSRLARLTDLVARSDGDGRPTVELDGEDELAQLATRIERTLGSLEVAQEALRETNAELAVANRMKDDFVSMVSHEFRTPLTSIRGYAETLLRYGQRIETDKREAFTSRITAQAQVLERMVDDLLTLAQSREGTVRAFPADVHVQSVVAEVVEPVAGDRDVVVDVDAELAAFADPDHVRRILVNYLENARKYGSAPITITAEEGADGVEVRVRDHGRGVEPAFVPSLFDRFTQASVGTQRTAKGVGLGLSIVRLLAEANGAEVWYEPADPGAVFGVRFPRRRVGDVALVLEDRPVARA